MNRTRWVFVLIVGAALAVVAAGILVPLVRDDNGDGDAEASGETIEVRVLTALPVEPWMRAAADQFNAGEHTIEGHPIRVTVVPMDGLSVLSKWDREEFPLLGDRNRDTLKTSWNDWPIFPRCGFLTVAIWSSWSTPPTKKSWDGMSF